MLITIDPSSPMPLAEQVAAAIRAALAEGRIRPGERLPTARELAAGLGINLHTVLKGYHQLSDEGLVSLRRGRGAVITVEGGRTAGLVDVTRDFVAAARRLGVTDEQIMDAVRSAVFRR